MVSTSITTSVRRRLVRGLPNSDLTGHARAKEAAETEASSTAEMMEGTTIVEAAIKGARMERTTIVEAVIRGASAVALTATGITVSRGVELRFGSQDRPQRRLKRGRRGLTDKMLMPSPHFDVTDNNSLRM